MDIGTGKFYKIVSKEYNGWFLSEDCENLAKETAKKMTNDVDAFAVPITDETEIAGCLKEIKTVVTFH